jgi:hypothetical protein
MSEYLGRIEIAPDWFNHTYAVIAGPLLGKQVVDLQSQVETLTAERDTLAGQLKAARMALAEVKRFWWPAFENMSQPTKDELEKAKWQFRDAQLQASNAEES